jgi:hypothetical protein
MLSVKRSEYQSTPSLFNLFRSQEKQKKDAEAASAGKLVKQSAGELRLQKGERYNWWYLINFINNQVCEMHRRFLIVPFNFE